MKTIAIANQKAGVGKTTSAINIGAGLTRLGKRVLLIDLDPQADLTSSLGIKAHQLHKAIYQVLKGDVPFEEIWIDRAGMMVLPSAIELARVERELSGVRGREYLLKEGMGKPWGFDCILIDCPSSLGLLTLNAFTAAREIYIPLQMDVSSLQSVGMLLQAAEAVEKWFNNGLAVTGVIHTRFDPSKTLNREVEEKMKAIFGNRLFITEIREGSSIAEASSVGKTIFEYNPESEGGEDYSVLCREIIERGWRDR